MIMTNKWKACSLPLNNIPSRTKTFHQLFLPPIKSSIKSIPLNHPHEVMQATEVHEGHWTPSLLNHRVIPRHRKKGYFCLIHSLRALEKCDLLCSSSPDASCGVKQGLRKYLYLYSTYIDLGTPARRYPELWKVNTRYCT